MKTDTRILGLQSAVDCAFVARISADQQSIRAAVSIIYNKVCFKLSDDKTEPFFYDFNGVDNFETNYFIRYSVSKFLCDLQYRASRYFD